jgi:hypothetical protein
MRKPYWSDSTATLLQSDAADIVRELPTATIDCAVLSPVSLRDRLDEIPRGLIADLRQIFADLRRALAADGTVWLHLTDLYGRQTPAVAMPGNRTSAPASRGKSLLGMPWQVALMLQQDGWLVRDAIHLAMIGGTPSGAPSRLNCPETIFLLSKRAGHYFDPRAMLQPRGCASPPGAEPESVAVGKRRGARDVRTRRRCAFGRHAVLAAACRSNHPRAALREHTDDQPFVAADVWTVRRRVRPAAFAELPIEVPLRAIAMGCRPGGTVLDPWVRDGTTGLAARRLDRRFIGAGTDDAYLSIAARRLHAAGGGDR